jgi:hypothetical protein
VAPRRLSKGRAPPRPAPVLPGPCHQAPRRVLVPPTTRTPTTAPKRCHHGKPVYPSIVQGFRTGTPVAAQRNGRLAHRPVPPSRSVCHARDGRKPSRRLVGARTGHDPALKVPGNRLRLCAPRSSGGAEGGLAGACGVSWGVRQSTRRPAPPSHPCRPPLHGRARPEWPKSSRGNLRPRKKEARASFSDRTCVCGLAPRYDRHLTPA